MNRKIFKKILLSLFSLSSIIGVLGTNKNHLTNSANNFLTESKKIQNINLESAFVKIQSTDSDETTMNFGVNRLEIFTRLDREQLNEIIKFIKHEFNNDIPVKYEEFAGVLSIAYQSIYNFNTNTQYEDFSEELEKNNDAVNLQTPESRYNYVNFETETQNDSLFSLVGLTKEVRQRHFNTFINNKLNVGVLETGVAETHSKAFDWNRKYGNGLWWRDAWFYAEKSSRHATQVSELIAGKKGIMPTLTIVSVQADTHWNGLSGEFNYLLGYTNLVNNSWGYPYDKNDKMRWLYNYLDNLIYNNPELINVVAAGNGFLDQPEMSGLSLSKNSIVVGASTDLNPESKSYYSQIGNHKNYLSVIAPGGDYWFSDRTKVWEGNQRVEKGYNNRGTSFSAPLITAIAGMLKQKYKNYFDLGSDSIIFKSALITGSRKPNGIVNLYTNETGFGIPQYDKIEKAIESLIVLPKAKNSTSNSRRVYFNQGDKIRASLAFLYNGTDDKTDVDFKVKNANGWIITSSNSSFNNIEVVEFTVPFSGWYTLEAYVDKSTRNSVEAAITYVKEN
ncbi:hypothetical protein CO229_01165 [Mycoplasmopsis bovirhinis]|uniref:S8 family serine peptidase n=1 Tax=Mycoplasmopsis bovirhinis TaxID=29553 RepID=UPI000C05824B|nr:S8 family serine peptidase [Mycoplasmopsis bovirhinis]ATO30729.1 hypothetical protein CO229_01165 [Mycoplasmopsis bovirhinis]